MPEGSIGEMMEIAVKCDGIKLGKETLAYYEKLIMDAYLDMADTEMCEVQDLSMRLLATK